MEYIVASDQARAHITLELQAYRDNPEAYVKQEHPGISFQPLATLLSDTHYTHLLDQALFTKAIALLTQHLQCYGLYTPLDPERVWIGISQPLNTQ